MRMKIVSAITSEEQLLRKRFPRVIGGDNLLQPYDKYKAEGQVAFLLCIHDSASAYSILFPFYDVCKTLRFNHDSNCFWNEELYCYKRIVREI